MIYISCPTCGFFIGSKTLEYELKKESICANTSYSDEQIADEIQKLLKSLKIRRYCCRMRLMTGKDIVQDIVAPED